MRRFDSEFDQSAGLIAEAGDRADSALASSPGRSSPAALPWAPNAGHLHTEVGPGRTIFMRAHRDISNARS